MFGFDETTAKAATRWALAIIAWDTSKKAQRAGSAASYRLTQGVSGPPSIDEPPDVHITYWKNRQHLEELSKRNDTASRDFSAAIEEESLAWRALEALRVKVRSGP